MGFIRIGDVCGVYHVVNKSNKYTNRGSRCFDCICMVCGEKKIFSESYLVKLRQVKECICDKDQRNYETKKAFNFIKKIMAKLICAEIANICLTV